MTRQVMLDYLGRMIGDYGEDPGILDVYLDLAGQKILNRMYPFKESFDGLEVPERYAMTQLNVACFLYAKRGAEGQVQHIENGIHRNYGSSDVPNDMLKDVIPMAMAIR